MEISSTMILYVLLAICTYIGFNRLMRKRQLSVLAKKVGARPLVSYPGCGFGGLAHLRLILKADKDKLFPDMLVARQNLLSELHGREVSTFRFNALFQDIVFTSDPRNVQAMLATQFADYGLEPARTKGMAQTLGDGIFSQQGPKWQHSRALLRPSFARAQISDLELEERHVQNLLKAVPIQKDGWTAEIDIQTLFFRLTIDSATDFLFGESVGDQLAAAGLTKQADNSQSSLASGFAHHLGAAMHHLARRFRLGDFWWLHNPRSYQENCRFVNEFVDYYVRIALQKSESGGRSSDEKTGKHVFLEELAQRTRDPKELRAQLLIILVAGRDTTASLLSWTFHQLLRHPQAFTKLRTNIIESFGSFGNPRDISFETLKNCHYLQNCLMETLRLWTIVPLNSRRTNRVTTLPKGGGSDGESPIVLPANFDVHYSVHVMNRRKDIWGEDADMFKPERFAGRKLGWDFVPFGGGPRVCIGQQFALTEVSYIMVRLLQRFDQIEPGVNELSGPVKSDLHLSSVPAKPVTLRLHADRY